jgi:hypothetical protein
MRWFLFLQYFYIICSIVITAIFVYLKCYHKFDYFDAFLYDKGDNFYQYYGSHVLSYLFLGVFFGNEIIVELIFKTLIVEALIIYVQNCQVKTVAEKYNKLKHISIVCIVSYVVGAMFGDFFKSVLFRDKF